MKPNKKLIAIILALLVAFSSVACAKASEQEVAPTVSQIETPKEETVLKQEEPKEEKTAAAEKAQQETQQQTDDMPVTAGGSGNLTAGSVPQTNNQYQAPAGGYPEGVGPTGKGKFSTREAVESLASVDKVIGWNEEFGGWEVITDTGKHEIQFPNGTAMGIEFLEIFFPNGK